METNEHGQWQAVDDTLSVSSNGYVKTYCRNHGLRIYKPSTDNGHGYVVFKHNGVSMRFHRLVCRTFHGPEPFEGAVVDHINRNSHDNRAANLRWSSKSLNAVNINKVVRRNLKHSDEPQDPIPGEIWKTTGRFKISNMGRARVLKHSNKHPELEESWYPIFTPRPQGRAPYARLSNTLFHILVAKEFLGAPDDAKKTVDHINQRKDDNRVINLKWSTKKEQINNRTIKKKASCLSTPVNACEPNSDHWMQFPSYAEAARQLRQKLGNPFNHVNVARAARNGKPYNGVLFAHM